jgi:hypothetical protein
MKTTEKESTVWDPLLHFLDKHYVAFSIVVGLLISFLIRRRTRPKRKDDEGNGPSLDDLLRQGTDPLECGGETDTYRWTQGEDEIDVYVSVDRLRGDDGNGEGGGAVALSSKPAISKRDVVCKFSANKIYLSVLGKVIMDGKPYKPIDPDECTWQIERGSHVKDAGAEAKKGDELWVTLRKQKPTMKNMHWRCVVQGHKEIDTTKFGPRVMTIDPNDPAAMARAVKESTGRS